MAGHETAAGGDRSYRHEATSEAIEVRRYLRRGGLTLGPIGTALAMVFHPHAGEDPFASIAAAADTWLLVHVLMFASLTLLGVGTYLMLARIPGPTALIGQVGAATFTLFYGGYVAMVGLSSGLIVRAGTGLSSEQQAGIDAALVYLLEEPAIMGVAVVGVLGFLVALVTAAIVYRRRNFSTVAILLLFPGVLALAVHSGPVAVAGMLAFLVGAVWIEYAVTRRRRSEVTADGE